MFSPAREHTWRTQNLPCRDLPRSGPIISAHNTLPGGVSLETLCSPQEWNSSPLFSAESKGLEPASVLCICFLTYGEGVFSDWGRTWLEAKQSDLGFPFGLRENFLTPGIRRRGSPLTTYSHLQTTVLWTFREVSCSCHFPTSSPSYSTMLPNCVQVVGSSMWSYKMLHWIRVPWFHIFGNLRSVSRSCRIIKYRGVLKAGRIL